MFAPIQSRNFLKISFIVFIFLLFINVVILDIVILFKNTSIIQKDIGIQKVKSDVAVVGRSTSSDMSCPKSCLLEIEKVTSTIEKKPTISTKVSEEPAIESSKEYIITFGSGTNATDEWTDVSGLQIYIDNTKYGQIKTVLFEASVRIPTGNQIAYVRLFNTTDKHPVWFSDVSLEGGTPRLLVSKPIMLDSGNKLYQVQMKTSLKYQAILDQAIVRITTY